MQLLALFEITFCTSICDFVDDGQKTGSFGGVPVALMSPTY